MQVRYRGLCGAEVLLLRQDPVWLMGTTRIRGDRDEREISSMHFESPDSYAYRSANWTTHGTVFVHAYGAAFRSTVNGTEKQSAYDATHGTAFVHAYGAAYQSAIRPTVNSTEQQSAYDATHGTAFVHAYGAAYRSAVRSTVDSTEQQSAYDATHGTAFVHAYGAAYRSAIRSTIDGTYFVQESMDISEYESIEASISIFAFFVSASRSECDSCNESIG